MDVLMMNMMRLDLPPACKSSFLHSRLKHSFHSKLPGLPAGGDGFGHSPSSSCQVDINGIPHEPFSSCFII